MRFIQLPQTKLEYQLRQYESGIKINDYETIKYSFGKIVYNVKQESDRVAP